MTNFFYHELYSVANGAVSPSRSGDRIFHAVPSVIKSLYKYINKDVLKEMGEKGFIPVLIQMSQLLIIRIIEFDADPHKEDYKGIFHEYLNLLNKLFTINDNIGIFIEECSNQYMLMLLQLKELQEAKYYNNLPDKVIQQVGNYCIYI